MRTIDRRSVLRLFGAAAIGVAGTRAFGRTGLDLAAPEDYLPAAVKLRGSLDDRL